MRTRVLALVALLGAAPAMAQEPVQAPKTVPEALLAMRKDGRDLVEALATTQFKVDAAQYPGTTAWVADLQVVRASFEGKPPEAWVVDVDALTVANPDFWAMIYETYPDDAMLMGMIAALRLMAGEAYRAAHLTILGERSPGRPAMVRGVHQRLNWWIQALFRLSQERIQAGIRLHDAGDFDGAIAAYRAHLAEWPQDGWAHYELGQSLMIQTPGDLVKPDAPLAAEYALARRYHPLQVIAWQGMTPGIVEQAIIVRGEVDPGWTKLCAGQLEPAALATLSEALQKVGVHDLALFVRQLRVAVNVGYEASDREFIAKGLRALVPGEVTEATIARLMGEPRGIRGIARFEGPPPDFKWKR